METLAVKKRNAFNLSRRELEVINLLAFEYSTKEIADMLYVSFETVKTHRKNLLQKCRVRNVAGLVRIACEHNMVSNHAIENY